MIDIIGAGPAGCYAAYLLSKKNTVDVYEQKKKIGHPVQCTGIVTSTLKETLDFRLPSEAVINKVDDIRIYSPDHNFISLSLKAKNLILDRARFDELLAAKAEERGARIHLQHKVMAVKNDFFEIKDIKKGIKLRKEKDILIGADGPLSIVRESMNNCRISCMTGLQFRVKMKNENFVEFYPYIGAFAWIVPESRTIARIGVASYKNPANYINSLLKAKKIRGIIERQGGLIPIYNPMIRTQQDNTLLVGDAATQVKATTGGGIIQCLLAARCLIAGYEKGWKRKIGRELWTHLKIRNMLDRFKPEDWNMLTSIFKKKANKRILENFDRDRLSHFLPQLALQEPRLLCFVRYLI